MPRALVLAALVGHFATCSGLVAQDRLIDSDPFDRIILDDANEGRALDVAPLDFNGRKVPDPLPRSGTLRVRLIDRPPDQFDIRWANIAEIRLFEMLVLDEAKELAKNGRFKAAHEYLAYLKRERPELPGLAQAAEDILESEATQAYQRGEHERAWMVLTALFERNPQRPGIDRALGSIADRLLETKLAEGDYRAARKYLVILDNRFGPPGRAVATRWRAKLRGIAAARVTKGRADLASGDLDEARRLVREALTIEPGLAEAQKLAREIAVARPRVVVAVVAQAPERLTRRMDDWASRRIEPLVAPPLVELRGFGAEGGEYESAYGKLLLGAGNTSTSIVFPPTTSREGLGAHAVARQLLSAAVGAAGRRSAIRSRPANTTVRQELLAKHLAGIAVDGTNTLKLTWKQPHVRPESLLQVGLAEMGTRGADSGMSSGHPRSLRPAGFFEVNSRGQNEVTLVRADGSANAPQLAPVEVVERLFESDDDAVDALLRGEVDVVERVAATHVPRLSRQSGIVVDEYALPTVHVLIASPTKRLLSIPELRRAIVYGVNRQGIVQQLVISDGPAQSATVVSGPFPPGRDFADPVGYAYNRSIVPRPYDPRLAATLASVAARLGGSSRTGDAGGQELPELTLAHPDQPLPRAACQIIREQLAAVGVSVKLVQCRPDEWESQQEGYDLRYAELAMWEPVVDAGRLLGPRGELDHCSARMALALANLEEARTWQDVRQRLGDVHRVAHDELDVIPLWQTTNYFAYRDHLRGVAERPVTLYQGARAWDLSGMLEGEAP